jgi:ATP-dependent helicase HrpB
MACLRGEVIGETVGYRMRLDTKVGPTTRIEVVTEGILTRLLQHDPSLRTYGIVLFDEFHERSLQADAGLALCLETQRLFRPDLRLLVMSATLDVGPVADLLGGAPVLSSTGRLFPVETRYLDQPLSGALDAAIVQVIRGSLARESGSILVFLPGMAEIRRLERTLGEAHLGSNVLIAPLHGDLPQDAQDLAIAPAPPGLRKIVLATSIAESSLTIDGVRIVIDAGLLRLPRFDPRSGLTRLDTIRVTQDSADQRRGRAGRIEPGVCYRLWTEREQRSLVPRRPPEILDADLAPMLLDLALYGIDNPTAVAWLSPPPSGAILQAKELLAQLGALDNAGHITSHGRQLADIPVHPRLAHMLVSAKELHLTKLACEIAALLSERDILRGPSGWRNADLRIRLDVLHERPDQVTGAAIDHPACRRVRQTAALWLQQLSPASEKKTAVETTDSLDDVGLLLALAYPDRIAQRNRGGESRYLLANGRGAFFATTDPTASEAYLVIADLDGSQPWARINLAAPISQETLERVYADRIRTVDSVAWDERTQAVRATRKRQLGSLVLSEHLLASPDSSLIHAALLAQIKQRGLDILAWTSALRQWRSRVQFLRRMDCTVPWPDLSDETLLETLEQWLGPYLDRMIRLDQVQRMDLGPPLRALLTWEQQRRLDRLAPAQVTVPSGSQITLDYEHGDSPVLSVRLQEMFGCRDTPHVMDGQVPVMLHLLSPARRPVQVTKNLASFWASAYHDVKKDLRGRYPKHDWPDDPLAAPPTAKPKRRRP